MKALKWLGVMVGVILVLVLLFMLQPWCFLPHRHISIGLPIRPADDASTYLIPMGEKIAHNASNGTPNGHPGLDFGGWNRSVDIVSVSDGWVASIHKINKGTTTVTVYSGFYKITYQELNDAASSLHFLSRVKKGDLIGRTGYYRPNLDEKPKTDFPSPQLHWDFASASMAIDRLCPTNYFDADARERIETIWAKVPVNDQFKSRYPEICNGIYKDKEE